MVDIEGFPIYLVGYGFVEGEDAFCVDAVRKARKEYSCEGVIRAVRDTDNISPGTGDSILEMQSEDCTGKIRKGDLHVVLVINDLALYDSYWTTWRMCLPCALFEHVVEYRQAVVSYD